MNLTVRGPETPKRGQTFQIRHVDRPCDHEWLHQPEPFEDAGPLLRRGVVTSCGGRGEVGR